MINSDALAAIFAGVNDNLEGLDDDSHEFTFEEFYVAMCLVAVHCNRPMDAIVFPGTLKGETLTQQHKKKGGDGPPQPTGELTKLLKQVNCDAVGVLELCG